jgi:predicted ABC-type transport system involved in lysophospholipase L1 biosynthesis ATPase subunit
MAVPLELTGLTKTFETPSGPFVAVKNVNVRIDPSEFVCILGHSGCGKSTVLSIIAGLQKATQGGVAIHGKQIDAPGPDRAVVFQSPSLLPWLSARDNVTLAVGQKFRHLSGRKRNAHAARYLDLVGVSDSSAQAPAELSLGTQQCVSLARKSRPPGCLRAILATPRTQAAAAQESLGPLVSFRGPIRVCAQRSVKGWARVTMRRARQMINDLPNRTPVLAVLRTVRTGADSKTNNLFQPRAGRDRVCCGSDNHGRSRRAATAAIRMDDDHILQRMITGVAAVSAGNEPQRSTSEDRDFGTGAVIDRRIAGNRKFDRVAGAVS